MKVTHYSDPATNLVYREIREKDFLALEALNKAYKDRGHKTWLMPLDFNNLRSDESVLTVLLKKEVRS